MAADPASARAHFTVQSIRRGDALAVNGAHAHQFMFTRDQKLSRSRISFSRRVLQKNSAKNSLRERRTHITCGLHYHGEAAMASELERIPTFFKHWVTSQENRGAVGDVAQWLADGGLDPAGFDARIAQFDVASDPAFRGQLLDLVLDYARHRLMDAPLTIDDVVDLRLLTGALRIADGSFFQHRRDEVAALLEGSLSADLENDFMADAEDLHLVGIQAAFDLSYDQFLTLAQPAYARALATLRERLEAMPPGDERSRAQVTAKLAAIEPAYRLAEMQTYAPRSTLSL
jgi:hypothetical protein